MGDDLKSCKVPSPPPQAAGGFAGIGINGVRVKLNIVTSMPVE
ncbi:MAG: hypothetical protein U9P10_13130 [Thermodesulfobacteriota bacterium]|nr:hypothetical protein [Thermodesulfobacteriota bacterium]